MKAAIVRLIFTKTCYRWRARGLGHINKNWDYCDENNVLKAAPFDFEVTNTSPELAHAMELIRQLFELRKTHNQPVYVITRFYMDVDLETLKAAFTVHRAKFFPECFARLEREINRLENTDIPKGILARAERKDMIKQHQRELEHVRRLENHPDNSNFDLAIQTLLRQRRIVM